MPLSPEQVEEIRRLLDRIRDDLRPAGDHLEAALLGVALAGLEGLMMIEEQRGRHYAATFERTSGPTTSPRPAATTSPRPADGYERLHLLVCSEDPEHHSHTGLLSAGDPCPLKARGSVVLDCAGRMALAPVAVEAGSQHSRSYGIEIRCDRCGQAPRRGCRLVGDPCTNPDGCLGRFKPLAEIVRAERQVRVYAETPPLNLPSDYVPPYGWDVVLKCDKCGREALGSPKHGDPCGQPIHSADVEAAAPETPVETRECDGTLRRTVVRDTALDDFGVTTPATAAAEFLTPERRPVSPHAGAPLGGELTERGGSTTLTLAGPNSKTVCDRCRNESVATLCPVGWTCGLPAAPTPAESFGARPTPGVESCGGTYRLAELAPFDCGCQANLDGTPRSLCDEGRRLLAAAEALRGDGHTLTWQVEPAGQRWLAHWQVAGPEDEVCGWKPPAAAGSSKRCHLRKSHPGVLHVNADGVMF